MGNDPRSFSNALDDNPLSYWHAKIDNSKSDTVTATFKERSLSSTNYSGDPESRTPKFRKEPFILNDFWFLNFEVHTN